MPEDEQQPKFPQIGINVNQQGVFISYVLAPGMVLQAALDENTMNEICKQWLETRKQVKAQLQLVRDVIRTKN